LFEKLQRYVKVLSDVPLLLMSSEGEVWGLVGFLKQARQFFSDKLSKARGRRAPVRVGIGS
jgi:hypothetical protein